mgnify:CR=1 FL=1
MTGTNDTQEARDARECEVDMMTALSRLFGEAYLRGRTQGRNDLRHEPTVMAAEVPTWDQVLRAVCGSDQPGVNERAVAERVMELLVNLAPIIAAKDTRIAELEKRYDELEAHSAMNRDGWNAAAARVARLELELANEVHCANTRIAELERKLFHLPSIEAMSQNAAENCARYANERDAAQVRVAELEKRLERVHDET